MAEQMPVNPAIIGWARDRAGLTLADAEERFPKIAVWENPNGDSRPTYVQLEKLADTFKVPIAVFFFPNPPEVPSITKDFRTLPATELNLIAPKIRLLLRKAKAYQLSLAELNGGRNPAPRMIIRDLTVAPSTTPKALSKLVRDYFSSAPPPSDDQTATLPDSHGASTAELALEKWRATFASVGIYVFKDAFKAPKYAGFCLYDREFPIIYVNNSAAKERQIFTLFHELGHLLFGTSGIDFRSESILPHLEGDARRIEVLCNRFAGEFLVPEDELRSEIVGEPTEAAARLLAKRFNVSWIVIYRRFLDLRMISREDYAAAQSRADEAQSRRPDDEGGGNYYNTTMSYLGREFLGMAMREYFQSRINERQLAEHLGVPPKNLPGIEDRFLRWRARA